MMRIGVIGGGQLAWMMAGAAESLGIELVVQTPHPTDPAVATATDSIFARIDDGAATAELAKRCDVITFENEFINVSALIPLESQGVCFRPGLSALAPLLDKYHQRSYLQNLGLPVPSFFAIAQENTNSRIEDNSLRSSALPLASSAVKIKNQNFPVVLKARRHGYDGQGTFILKNREALESTLQQLGNTPVLLEEYIPFEKELAALAARSVTGEVVVYPVVETQQEQQVCRRVLVPADIPPAVEAEIQALARTLLDSLQAVGVFGIELFLTRTGKILVNEVSPRTHNSGHFTIDACYTSQFEQHLRAVAGLPLGNPALRCGGAVMVNLLGYEDAEGNDYLGKRQQILKLPQSHVHWYGKTASRPGRKLGHVTVLLESNQQSEARDLAQKIESIWYSE